MRVSIGNGVGESNVTPRNEKLFNAFGNDKNLPAPTKHRQSSTLVTSSFKVADSPSPSTKEDLLRPSLHRRIRQIHPRLPSPKDQHLLVHQLLRLLVRGGMDDFLVGVGRDVLDPREGRDLREDVQTGADAEVADVEGLDVCRS